MRKSNEFANKLAKNFPGRKTPKSKSGAPLFFKSETISEKFRDLFEIQEKTVEKFDCAFQIATGGPGNELTKINSIASSALLPLLVFHPLFDNLDKNECVRINGKDYYRAFFEVRNRVVRKPSCVDVVLKSTDDKTLLYLESKLTEYIDGQEDKAQYGRGYCDLYSDDVIKSALKRAGFNEPAVKSDGIELSMKQGKAYIEGIKQSFSHLIGLVRGPMDCKDEDSYPKSYQEEYLDAYKNADTLIYASIIYDPKVIGIGKQEYESYVELYKSVFSDGEKIISSIKTLYVDNKDKNIEIVCKPMTYQNIFSNNQAYLDKFIPEVKRFYNL